MNGSALEEKSYFKLLDWLCLPLSLLLKVLPRKLEPWFIVWSFFLLRLLCTSVNLSYSHGISRCYKGGVYVNSFFHCTARRLNSLSIECFPLTYDLNDFKSRVNRLLFYCTQQTYAGLQDVLKTSWRRIQLIFCIKIFPLSRRFQDVLEDEKLLHWRLPEDVLKTCLEDLLKTCFEDVLKLFFENALKPCLDNVLKTCLEDGLRTCLEDVLKTCLEDVLKTCLEDMSWRCFEDVMGASGMFAGIPVSSGPKSVSRGSMSRRPISEGFKADPGCIN